VLAVSHHIVAEGREASDVSQRLTLLRRFRIGVPSYLSAQALLAIDLLEPLAKHLYVR
jgi:hypothetical protein